MDKRKGVIKRMTISFKEHCHCDIRIAELYAKTRLFIRIRACNETKVLCALIACIIQDFIAKKLHLIYMINIVQDTTFG